MKKILYTVVLLGTLTLVKAQETAPETKTDAEKTEFDSKHRFGLRISPQPTWFVGDKNNIPAGAVFGFGFGLNLEYRFSNIACLLFGIGGDFEGGKYKVKYEPGVYTPTFWQDETAEFIEPAKRSITSTGYVLKERTVRATYASVPVILKLSTQEYSGVKYYGMFGVEFAYRVNAKSNDTYYQTLKVRNDSIIVLSNNESSESDVNIKSQTVPLRLGMNAGLGFEYRIAGSTSLFVNLNYFRSFSNFMKKESEFMYYRLDNGTSYKYVKQNLKITGIRIVAGIMF